MTPAVIDQPADPPAPKVPVSLAPVLEAELAEIRKVRNKRAPKGNSGVWRQPVASPEVPIPEAETSLPEWQTRDRDQDHWVKVIEEAHGANLVGLSLSGGGIRSATFSLGVLQAMAERKLLSRVDYLSTVSGGGYIGGWLAAWTKRRGSFAQVENRLATNRVNQEEDNEPPEIRFLRVFSNYLTPKIGLLSGDTLAAVGIILRNVLLNLAVLLAILVLLLLLPRAAVRCGIWARAALTGLEAVVLVSVLLAVGFVVILNNMIYLTRPGKWKLLWLMKRHMKGVYMRWAGRVLSLTQQKQILGLVAGPLLGSSILGALWRLPAHTGALDSYWAATIAGAAAYGVIWLVAIVLAWALQGLQSSEGKPKPALPHAKWSWPRAKEILESVSAPFTMVVTAVPTGASAGWLYAWLSRYMDSWNTKEALTFGVPLVLGIFLLTGTLHIGLMGTAFRDSRREWWGRLGGWLLLWGIAWLAFFWLALSFPDFAHTDFVKRTLGAGVTKYLTPASIVTTVAWVLTTAAGIWAANGDASGKPGETSWRDWLAKASPYIFIVGLLCWLSYSIDWIQSKYFLECVQDWFFPGLFVELVYCAMKVNSRLWWALGGCVAIALAMSWRVDINQFSLHLLYRNRLVRCFLGASNKRSPIRFTGFDENDDMPLTDLTHERGYDGPYPVFNAALNLVKGQDLAWQERKAESFVMTPLYCGFDVWLEEQDSPLLHGVGHPRRNAGLDRFGYRRTEEYAFPPPRRGLRLGTAMTISGAAASPNMGSYSSTAVAFLMTLFNVRLGQWLGNPRHKKTSGRPTPRFGLPYLLCELFAGTTDEARYVHVSDGGHFENMGLYEMVKRRCGLIIVCDAEADASYELKGLGNAIRKCRIDLGIDIDLDLKDITPEKVGEPSKRHCAVGTIHYEQADLKAPLGRIVYFKASLTGDESTDVNTYHRANHLFPHESTVDQWFSESQFEAYRKLGYHELMTSLSGAPLPDKTSQTDAAEDPVSKELRKILEDFGFIDCGPPCVRPANQAC